MHNSLFNVQVWFQL